jgi:ribose transport system permease protein
MINIINNNVKRKNEIKYNLLIFIKNNNVLFFLILFFIFSVIISPNFINIENIIYMLRESTLIGTMALGMTFVMIAGNVDLSIGYMMTLLTFLTVGFLKNNNLNYILVIIIILIIGCLIGLINGFIVGIVKVNSIMVTIGTGVIMYGISIHYTSGVGYMSVNPYGSFSLIAGGNFIGIPIPIIIFGFIFLISHIMLKKTKFGRYIFATGGDELTAWLYGIKTGKIKMMTFIINGFLVAVAAIIFASRTSSGTLATGDFYFLDVLTVVILGGTLISGGEGSAGKTFLGLITIAMLGNLLRMIGVPYAYQQFYKGILLIIALLINTLLRFKERRTI